MRRPDVQTVSIGAERQPLVIFDDLVRDAAALRAVAAAARFGPAGEHYPGLRAPLPDGYLAELMPAVAAAVGRSFGRSRGLRLIDASFSIVTTPPHDLTLAQRLPHVDAHGAERIAMVHYLSPDDADGTAFYRHRSTGFETIDAGRAPVYRERLAADLAEHGPPDGGYVRDTTALFERTLLTEARCNRALLYRSYVLHSGAISPDAVLSPDPRSGRLTVTAFFSLESGR